MSNSDIDMEEKIKLLLRYYDKEREKMMAYDKSQGKKVDPENYKVNMSVVGMKIKNFIEYRNIRIEEAWYCKLYDGNHEREVCERRNKYDHDRSDKHAMALNGLSEFDLLSKAFDLPKFYEGPTLTYEEIRGYKKLDVRKEMTNFFLQLIDQLSRIPSTRMQELFEEVGLDYKKADVITDVSELQKALDKGERGTRTKRKIYR